MDRSLPTGYLQKLQTKVTMKTPAPLKILIATSNPGKFQEFILEFADLPFTFVNLTDCGLGNLDVDEPYDTTEQNAIHKAKIYGQKSGLLTIAEDSGLFVRALQGAPGVHSKRYAPTAPERVKKLLAALTGVPTKHRSASFESSSCLYNPTTHSYTVFSGQTHGHITERTSRIPARPGLEYDSVFYYEAAKKIGTAISPAEKNLISHRGQLAIQLKIYLTRQLSFKQIIVPAALVVKDRKLFCNKRRDHRPHMNNKWEFPGGGIDNGEDPVECVKREIKEETGYTVEPIEMIPHMLSTVAKGASQEPYQVFIFCYICKITGGSLKVPAGESNGHGWFTLAEAKKLDFLALNKQLFRLKHTLAIIKKYID